MFHIVDWTGTVKFGGQRFNTLEAGDAFLSEYLIKQYGDLPEDEFGTMRGEYEVVEVEGVSA